jgi:hypothetical protein
MTLRTEILKVVLRLKTLCPSNSYIFGLDLTTWIEKMIFKEFDSREEYNGLERYLITIG